MMKLVSYTIAFLLSGSIAASAASSTAVLKQIKTHKDANGNFEAELYFDKSISKDQASVDYINDIIQINLSDVKLVKSKISQNIKDEKIKDLLAFKTGINTARTQIIYKKGIDVSKYLASVDTDKNILKIHVGYAANIEASDKKDISDEDLKEAAAWIEKADQQQTQNKKVAENKEAVVATTSVIATKADDKKSTTTINSSTKESEIPVLVGNKQHEDAVKTPSSARMLLSLGLVLAMISGFSFFAKKYFKKSPKNKNSQIKILTQHHMGPKKSLAIIQVAGESILIGVTEHNINLIKTLALLDEEIPQETPKDFSKSFKAIIKKDQLGEEEGERDEFAFSKIRDAVSSKLKNMKEI